LTSRLKRMVVSEKMIEDDLSRVEKSAIKSTYKLDVGFERCEDKGEKSAPRSVRTSNFHKEDETIKSTKTHYPSNPKPSFNPKREVRKETPKPREEPLIMLGTHIAMSLLIFHLILIPVLRLILLLVLCLTSFMELTIAHIVLVIERITLCLDALVTTHVLIMVIVSHVGMVSC
jgi:hypothetical protein